MRLQMRLDSRNAVVQARYDGSAPIPGWVSADNFPEDVLHHPLNWLYVDGEFLRDEEGIREREQQEEKARRAAELIEEKYLKLLAWDMDQNDDLVEQAYLQAEYNSILLEYLMEGEE